MKHKALEISLEDLVTEMKSAKQPPTDQGRIFSQEEAYKLFGVDRNAWYYLVRRYETIMGNPIRKWGKNDGKVVCEADLKLLAKWMKEQK